MTSADLRGLNPPRSLGQHDDRSWKSRFLGMIRFMPLETEAVASSKHQKYIEGAVFADPIVPFSQNDFENHSS